jgi:hypothetical protein
MSTRPTVLHTKGYGMIIFVPIKKEKWHEQWRWNAKVITFFQIYPFLDSDFSTLIENRNNFQFSQAVCAKSSGKLTCLKPREIPNMLIPI